MLIHIRKRFLYLAGTIITLFLFLLTRDADGVWQSAKATAADQFVYLPLTLQPDAPPPGDNWLAYVNYYRGLAGVPAVGDNGTLNDNCFQHARYMAENNDLTHEQDLNLPWASPAGQVCAQKGNAWLGGEFQVPYWKPSHSIDGWMASVGHRLWLLYPTTSIFGYGFYAAANNRAGAGLDVLSHANMSVDAAYTGWPVRYPAPNQSDVPATKYPITLNWPYFGPTPVLTSVTLTTGGAPMAHTANTALSAGHKGVQVLPTNSLPANATVTVSITGIYGGSPFSYTWQFSTGGPPAGPLEQGITTDWQDLLTSNP